MHRIAILSLFILTLPTWLWCQKICGYITSKNNGEAIIGATIYNETSHTGCITNDYGFFSLNTGAGLQSLRVSHINYIPKTVNVTIGGGETVFNFELEALNDTIEEVAVTASTLNPTRKTQNLHQKILSANELQKLPLPFGEPDLIKALQIQPGIKNTADGSSALFVRGGRNDQNLILIDEAPIYNTTHLFGMVSVINADALNDATTHTGVIPANTGGRLASVIDVKTREGNLKEYQFCGGISPFALRMTHQGPIIKERASYLVSVRGSYLDRFIQAGNSYNFVPSFLEINGKINAKLNTRNRLFLALYKNNDHLKSFDGLSNTWGNSILSLRHNYTPYQNWFINTSLIVSQYHNQIAFNDTLRQFSWTTGIQDYLGKMEGTWYLNNTFKLNGGIQLTLHQYTPGTGSGNEEIVPNTQYLERSCFVRGVFTAEYLKTDMGFRYSQFSELNDGSTFYQGLEPRINFISTLSQSLQLQAGYGRVFQYDQLLQNQILPYSSIESWIPSSSFIFPQHADVFTLGIQMTHKKCAVLVESYYKMLTNQPDFVDHAKILNNLYAEQEIRQGKGKAYGLEASINQSFGRFQSGISYNWSRSLLLIPEIQSTGWYPAAHDIPHDFRLTGTYKTRKRWEFSALWVFHSGKPTTLPIGLIYQHPRYVPIYSRRNSARLPVYHRLDIAARLYPKNNSTRYKSSLCFGIYNVYARQNPLGYQFDFDPIEGNIKAYQYNFIRIFPNITYTLEF